MIGEVRKKVRADLESPREMRRIGSGWLSGAAALVAAVAGLCLVLCLRYPWLLTVPQLRPYYHTVAFRLGLHFLLIAAFALSAASLALRRDKILGSAAVCITLLAALGRVAAPRRRESWHPGRSWDSTGLFSM